MPRCPRGLNSGKTAAQTCIRSCSVGDKWTIPVGVCTASFQLCGQGDTGAGHQGAAGASAVRVPRAPHCNG
ncbi:hypothetical protein [Streptomyces sp. NPDC096323]|uniref:hypothetical protein n=1 Tax=Streptomyces sp. NPDC096323 TaxID=3155822 RepID=UPI0033264490